MPKITHLSAIEVLDSRGNWTISARLGLDGGDFASAGVPAGASVGFYEKKTVSAKSAVSNINGLLKSRLLGSQFENLKIFDQFLINFDSDPERRSLGANTTLALSMAFAKAQASREKRPLYKFIASLFGNEEKLFMPTPLFNVINGGRHAENDLDFQEFHFIVPPSNKFEQTLESAATLFHNLGSLLESNGLGMFLGDEGGYAPQNISHLRAFQFIIEAGQKTKLEPGKDFCLGLDAAASTLSLGDVYEFKREGLKRTDKELKEFYLEIMNKFPLVYLEDPFGQDEFEDFAGLLKTVGDKVAIAGDDLVATNLERLRRSIKKQAINAVIIKPNQIGTLSESLEVARAALKNNVSLVVSHRSAETEDTYIADLAVGLGAKFLKAGAPVRGERVAKYNRLLEIDQEISGESQ